ncbi:MAG TPA: hypothetical protein VNT00_01180 [Eoetvoesiella sp.]|jgi:hypothetical protein|uniref:hypothetical protein n=1 Tax=Eoetvoesiella sp. TaxID=1966355 RepID=UPI002BB7A78E|nr:hypothetical protein [Eoetvoesiella sp.]HWK60005.1 hypothetical protein [Eoetvoesiella sp.]
MSTDTGRYASSHGSFWNFVPLSIGVKTLGDHVRPHGVRCAVAGRKPLSNQNPGWFIW